MFPVMLNVRGRRCLVVGGGGVALRKVSALLQEGAAVTAVAAEPSQPLLRLAAEGRVTLERRPYRDGEASGYALVFAATDDRSVNARVSRDAESAGLWVNVADDPDAVLLPAPGAGPARFATGRRGLRRRGAVRGSSTSPATRPPPGAGVGPVAGVGRALPSSGCAPLACRRVEQEACFDRFFAETVDPRKLTARVPPAQEVGAWLERPGVAATTSPEASDTPMPAQTAGAGLVSLVGAGPGDPGLLTMRGERPPAQRPGRRLRPARRAGHAL